MTQGCTCHIAPPCSFCESLTEDEYTVFEKGGLAALQKYRDQRDYGAPEDCPHPSEKLK